MKTYALTITVEDQDGNTKSRKKTYTCGDERYAIMNTLHQETTFTYMQMVDLLSRRLVRSEMDGIKITYKLDRTHE